MALTRAQYLAPGGGINALTGQVQGVKQGGGIQIAADGTISFNPGTATGVVTTISGGGTGLTFSGNPAGLWTMAGTLAVASGGTGATTSTGSINNLLPSQSGQSGRYLRTDGANVSWAVADALPPQGGNAGLFLTTNGTIAAWAPVPPGPVGPTGPLGPVGPVGPEEVIPIKADRGCGIKGVAICILRIQLLVVIHKFPSGPIHTTELANEALNKGPSTKASIPFPAIVVTVPSNVSFLI
jgi:hypothetical protein